MKVFFRSEVKRSPLCMCPWLTEDEASREEEVNFSLMKILPEG